MLSKIPKCFDTELLMTKDQVLTLLRENGRSDRALVPLRATYCAVLGDELMWLYPISFDGHLGARIIAVREGFLFLPYDSIDADEYEIFSTEDARLVDADELRLMRNLLYEYTEDIFQAFGDAMHLLQGRKIASN